MARKPARQPTPEEIEARAIIPQIIEGREKLEEFQSKIRSVKRKERSMIDANAAREERLLELMNEMGMVIMQIEHDGKEIVAMIDDELENERVVPHYKKYTHQLLTLLRSVDRAMADQFETMMQLEIDRMATARKDVVRVRVKESAIITPAIDDPIIEEMEHGLQQLQMLASMIRFVTAQLKHLQQTETK